MNEESEQKNNLVALDKWLEEHKNDEIIFTAKEETPSTPGMLTESSLNTAEIKSLQKQWEEMYKGVNSIADSDGFTWLYNTFGVPKRIAKLSISHYFISHWFLSGFEKEFANNPIQDMKILNARNVPFYGYIELLVESPSFDLVADSGSIPCISPTFSAAKDADSWEASKESGWRPIEDDSKSQTQLISSRMKVLEKVEFVSEGKGIC